MSVRTDAQAVMKAALNAALPDTAVKKALQTLPDYKGKLILVAAGKAAWQMAKSAYDEIGDKIDEGIVITKHDHSMGPIGNIHIYEAGHPVPDADSYSSTQEALKMVEGLTSDDLVLFLLSGGGSALFEKPMISEEEMGDVTNQLLASGADIVEMNILRKRLSAVKGGRFALACKPAHVYSVVLSDILGDPLDMIASGPAYPDASTCEQAVAIVKKYDLKLSDEAKALLEKETPKQLDNVTTTITGSVRQLCLAAETKCRELGYTPIVLSASVCCEAREAGSMLASIAQMHQGEKVAYIMGGETVVHLKGKGKGGRNQEIALGAVKGIAGLKDTVVFSLGSDGTDGPTDAAGGIVDENALTDLKAKGIDVDAVLADNDAYNALKQIDGLIITGPTGTNVNDLS
ncbi:MAG: glycerate kinase, partial [Erysipelotrichaceae bacterium]|nr:glycerate kinase [Erysipelotrichaceae bacterium]